MLKPLCGAVQQKSVAHGRRRNALRLPSANAAATAPATSRVLLAVLDAHPYLSGGTKAALKEACSHASSKLTMLLVDAKPLDADAAKVRMQER